MAGVLPDGFLPEGHLPDGHIPDASGASSTPSSRRRFKIKPQRRRFYIRTSASGVDVNDEYLFDPVVKDPGSTRIVDLDLYEICAAKWQPNETVAANEFCRPRIPNGFSYEATTGGLTSGREPHWPTTIARTVTDGECVWTCRASSGGGVNAVTDPDAESSPEGLTISSVSVTENCKIAAVYSGGVEGQDYDAVFTWTLEGVPWVGRQRVQVRKQ